MGRISKQMTPEQFSFAMMDVADNIGNILPVMNKFAKRYQATMRRNVRTSMNANNEPMAPLAPLTMKGKITRRDGRAGAPRRSYGNRPLLATGEMVRALKAVADAKGWIAHVTDEHKRMISFWQGNVPSGETLRIRSHGNGMAMARAMAAKGMPVSAAAAVSGFQRPARLPFALNSRQVKRSITDLNKFILKPFIS